MLVLTRRSGQAIRIGDDVVVRVLSAEGGQLRLGIEAPREVRVHREEVYEALALANEEAGRPGDPRTAARAAEAALGNAGREGAA